MKISQYLAIFSILLLTAQCRKIEIPEPVEGSPVFFLNTDLAGLERKWSAGEDGYYLHTSFEQDSSGLFVYSGSMEELGCSAGCLPAVKISFRGVKKGEALPDSTLKVGAYTFFQPLQGQMEIRHSVHFSGESTFLVPDEPYAYEWDFGDGETSSLQSPSHEYYDDSSRLVRLTVTSASGYTAISEKRIEFDSTAQDCSIDFYIISTQGGVAQAVLEFPGQFMGGYWNTGDSIASDIIFALSPGGSFLLCATGTTFNGCNTTSCQTAYYTFIQGAPYIASCSAGFSYQAQKDTLFLPPPEQLGTVVVEYTDANGVQYSSAWGLQDGFNPEFELLSVEPFEKNEDGLPTRKLEVAFRCQLFSENGQPFGQFSGSGVIAVAIPE